jgi:cysteinyl-tRNA synthetase
MGMALQLFNTWGREKQTLETGDRTVGMYVCGPSTYDHAHVGHARSYVAFDVLRRVLEFRGHDVHHVMNFTDLEKAIADDAREAGEDMVAYADRYVDSFLEDMDALGVLRAHDTPRVSDYVDEIQEASARLLETGQAYEEGGSVYFDTSTASGFGDLVGQDPDDLVVEEAEDPEERRHPHDFALWKATDDWGRTWDSRWGPGRPGWHVECTVMAQDHLGASFDVHGGGLDLVFPHHEAERAVGRALTGEEYARFWLHNGFVTMGHEKMSKSTGNFVQVREIRDAFDPGALRAYLLSEPYRATVDHDPDAMEAWSDRYAGWRETVDGLPLPEPGEGPPPEEAGSGVVGKRRRAFHEAMADDLDTGRALGALEGALERAERDPEEAGALAAEAGPILGLFRDVVPSPDLNAR